VTFGSRVLLIKMVVQQDRLLSPPTSNTRCVNNCKQILWGENVANEVQLKPFIKREGKNEAIRAK
jgi:hypothetical protein